MAESTLPTLHQAITASYPLRQILHAVRVDKKRAAVKTLCGRNVAEAHKDDWTPDIERACQRCAQSREKMIRAHEGWE